MYTYVYLLLFEFVISLLMTSLEFCDVKNITTLVRVFKLASRNSYEVKVEEALNTEIFLTNVDIANENASKALDFPKMNERSIEKKQISLKKNTFLKYKINGLESYSNHDNLIVRSVKKSLLIRRLFCAQDR